MAPDTSSLDRQRTWAVWIPLGPEADQRHSEVLGAIGKSAPHACTRRFDFSLTLVFQLFRSPEHLHGWCQVETSNRALPAPSDAPNNTFARATAAKLPPELFEYIFRASDVELSRIYRLVCRYWNIQCFAYAFREIDLKKSPERMLDLCNFTSVPMLRRCPQYVRQIKNVPFYDKRSKSPWIHLLSPEWKKDGEYITIQGPFSGGHRTIRSIHFAIPRSPLPASFSRGIRCLRLHRIKFNRFEDMARLAYELSELKQFTCAEVKWKALPNRPPRRQRRNQLSSINVQDCDPPTSDWSAYISAIVYVYLALYDAVSFFPEDLVTAILAASKTMRSLRESFNMKYDHNPTDHSRRLGKSV